MPESPAAAAIGTADATILKPATPKDLAASLVRIASRGGKITSGISLEFSPAKVFLGSRNIRGYATRALNGGGLSPSWIWANTTLSLATGAKEGTGTSTDKIAAGIKVPLYDDSDPRLNLALFDCFRDVQARLAAATPRAAANAAGWLPVSVGEARSRMELEELETSMNRGCLANNKAPWNAGSAAFAMAQVWTDIGNADRARLTRDATYAWFSMASSLGTSKERGLQLTGQARFARDLIDTTRTVAAGAPPIRYKAAAAALQLKLGEEKLNADLAGSYERRNYSDGKRDNVLLAALGLEFEVSPKVWLKLSLGYEKKDLAGNAPFLNTSFKWGVNDKADTGLTGLQKTFEASGLRAR
jgi:hypothetical protein